MGCGTRAATLEAYDAPAALDLRQTVDPGGSRGPKARAMTAHIRRAAEIRAMVEREPGITSAEIARRLGVSPASVSLALAHLKAGGDVRMVKRGKGQGLHPSDRALRRRYLVQLKRI